MYIALHLVWNTGSLSAYISCDHDTKRKTTPWGKTALRVNCDFQEPLRSEAEKAV